MIQIFKFTCLLLNEIKLEENRGLLTIRFYFTGQYQYSKKESFEHDAMTLTKKNNSYRRIDRSQEYESSQICMDILKRNLLKLFLPNRPNIARITY